MRAEIPGAVRLPVGWNRVLADVGLTGVTAFSYLVDLPAPLGPAGRAAVTEWLTWMSGALADDPAEPTDAADPADAAEPTDAAVMARLIDPTDQAYIAARDDVFILKTNTVHVGWHHDG